MRSVAVCAVALAIVAVLLSAGLSYGGEKQTGVPDEVLKEREYVVGTWKMEANPRTLRTPMPVGVK